VCGWVGGCVWVGGWVCVWKGEWTDNGQCLPQRRGVRLDQLPRAIAGHVQMHTEVLGCRVHGCRRYHVLDLQSGSGEVRQRGTRPSTHRAKHVTRA
jgi:hypothetical protein